MLCFVMLLIFYFIKYSYPMARIFSLEIHLMRASSLSCFSSVRHHSLFYKVFGLRQNELTLIFAHSLINRLKLIFFTVLRMFFLASLRKNDLNSKFTLRLRLVFIKNLMSRLYRYYYLYAFV